ncbi:MAG: YihY/virulence factor BrkB family protein [Deltaproteobacteria bacterium]|nr:YihY/virulence factor BrkB family protein [Deltaproteobacteria bacterium]
MTKIFDKIYELYQKLDKSGLLGWPLLAAALSYYSALAVVPILAICFALAKSLGLEDALKLALSENFSGQEALLSILTGFAQNLVNNFSGSVLVFTALGFIFWSVHGLLWQLELFFSHVYGYLSQRSAIHRATDYLTIMLVIPIFLVAAGSINILLTSLEGYKLHAWLQLRLQPINAKLMNVSPALIWWLVLSWTYSYFSRGIIGLKERLIGGLTTGIIFQIFQKTYLKVIISITSYNAVYGSFAMVPLFLLWLYISWLIVIGGGELTRRLADYFTSGLKPNAILVPLSINELIILGQKIIGLIVANFENEKVKSPTSIIFLAREMKIPIPHVGRAINALQAAGLLSRVASAEAVDGPSFLPASSPANLTPEKVREALESLENI